MDFKSWLVGWWWWGFSCGLPSAMAVNLLRYHTFVQEDENPNCCQLRWKPCNHDYRTINHTTRHHKNFFPFWFLSSADFKELLRHRRCGIWGLIPAQLAGESQWEQQHRGCLTTLVPIPCCHHSKLHLLLHRLSVSLERYSWHLNWTNSGPLKSSEPGERIIFSYIYKYIYMLNFCQ